MAVKRLLLLFMVIACSARGAGFGDIPASLALPAGTSVRRNAGNTAFEAYTPGSGGSSTFIGLDFTGNNLTFMNGTTMWKSTGDSSNLGSHPYTPTTAGIIVTDANDAEVWRLWADGSHFNTLLGQGIADAFVATDVNATNNTGIGAYAFQQLTTGGDNVAVGKSSNDVATTGSGNTSVGTNSASAHQTTDNSTEIGNSATAGEGSVALGYNAIAAGANVIIIGSSIFNNANDNIAIIGNASVTDAYFGSVSGNSILHGKGVLPTGGTAGQYLTKIDSTDFNAHWVTFPTPTATPTATATATATPSATATATPTPSATATAFPQGFTAHFSRGGAALQVNDVTLTPWTTKYPGTITGFIISADQGTCTLKVWKKATGTAIPTIADVINTIGVSLATGTHIDSTTVTDFTTTTVSIGDQFMAQITAVSGGATDITFQIPIRQ